jgi:hypothetical protein
MIMNENLNVDLTKRAIMHAANMEGQPSRSIGVWRKRFYRDGPAETGIVTSIVRYDAGSEFSDELGTYPAGTWARNPAGSSHAVRSEKGAILYVRFGDMET